MTRFLLALALLVGACQTLPATTEAPVRRDPSPAAEVDLFLPPASGPLSISTAQGPVTLAEVVDRFARLTDQSVVMSESSRTVMEQTVVQVEGASVPPEEVYAFVEALLHESRFHVAPLKAGSHPVLGIYSQGDRLTVTPLQVDADVAAQLADHPALMVRTVVQMPNSDVRTVQTQLRAMVTNTNVQRMLAAGERSMVLEGVASWVAATVATLREIDAAAAAR